MNRDIVRHVREYPFSEPHCTAQFIFMETVSPPPFFSATATPSKAATPSKTATPTKAGTSQASGGMDDVDYSSSSSGSDHPDNSFRQFCHLCECLEKEPSYNAKTKIISEYIKVGRSNSGEWGREELEPGFCVQETLCDLDKGCL